MIKKFTLLASATIMFASLFVLSGCDSEAPIETRKVEKTTKPTDQKNVITNSVTKFKGEIFSVPSPIQMVILLKGRKIPFNKEVINDVANKNKYGNQFQQALNMGVYGADLAYVSAYQKNQDILKYFSAVKGLADDLGIRSNIDENILTRFGDNISSIDSLYSLSGELYKEANFYLNDNNRNQVATLILVGGWIESMYTLANTVKDTPFLKQKLGEQKSAIVSLTKLLAEYDDPKVNVIKTDLKKINDIYKTLESRYSYIEPIHDVANKTTYLKSKTQIEMSDVELDEIVSVIGKIRTEIITK